MTFCFSSLIRAPREPAETNDTNPESKKMNKDTKQQTKIKTKAAEPVKLMWMYMHYSNQPLEVSYEHKKQTFLKYCDVVMTKHCMSKSVWTPKY